MANRRVSSIACASNAIVNSRILRLCSPAPLSVDGVADEDVSLKESDAYLFHESDWSRDCWCRACSDCMADMSWVVSLVLLLMMAMVHSLNSSCVKYHEPDKSRLVLMRRQRLATGNKAQPEFLTLRKHTP